MPPRSAIELFIGARDEAEFAAAAARARPTE